MGSLISTILSAYKASLDTSRERYQKAISERGKPQRNFMTTLLNTVIIMV